jgi:hypothetical protein
MKQRIRFFAIGLTVIGLTATSLTFTSPASAAQQTLAVNCSSLFNAYEVTLSIGDTLLISQTSCDAFIGGASGGIITYGGVNGTDSTFGPGAGPILVPGDKVLFTATQPTFGLNGILFLSASTIKATVDLVVPTDASDEGPPPLIQQFGKPNSGTCDSAQPKDLNWSGVASGGWGDSWAQWVNNGEGGAVCTRTLVYSTSQSKWILG